MKNILAIIILLSFLSCSNQKKAEEIIRKNIESQTVNGYTYNALIF
ncbi:putative lipoprotein, partial [Bacteroides fragilis str. 1007-1-F 